MLSPRACVQRWENPFKPGRQAMYLHQGSQQQLSAGPQCLPRVGSLHFVPHKLLRGLPPLQQVLGLPTALLGQLLCWLGKCWQ